MTDAPLAEAAATVARLDALCCDPGRSPRIAAVARRIDSARAAVTGRGFDPAEGQRVLDLLGEAGGLVGELQVGCCTPARMPLYASLLESLAAAQRSLATELGTGH